ncbi:MAG: CPBP family intramembrane metalloprotease [Bacteroidales bacterium]|nr:CPBP family intramembrane metalloprotease [Bacteroidales bacterium]
MTTEYTQGFRQSFHGMSPMAKILLVCLIVFLLMFISSVLSAVLAIPIFGLTLTGILEAISNPGQENLAVIKYFQIVQSVFVFIVPAIFVAWLFSRDTFSYIKANIKPYMLTVLMVLGSIILAIPILNVLTVFNSQLDLPDWLGNVEKEIIALEESACRLTKLFLDGDKFKDLALNLIMIAILPAVGEEFLFRGVFQRLFSEWTRSHHWGVLLGAFIFSFFHFQFFGFLPRFILGIYFGYLFVWSGTIWVPVAGHFINNGLAVIYYHFSSEEMGETMLDRIGTSGESPYILIISSILATALIYATFRFEKAKKSSDR